MRNFVTTCRLWHVCGCFHDAIIWVLGLKSSQELDKDPVYVSWAMIIIFDWYSVRAGCLSMCIELLLLVLIRISASM